MTNIDNKIEELLTLVEKQREEVKLAEKESKSSWKTNCSFISASGVPVNIQVADEGNLISLCGYLIQSNRSFNEACSALTSDDLSTTALFTTNGYNYDDWMDDFKKRFSILKLSEKKAKLAKLETRLNSIVSEDTRRKMELELIMKDLESE